MVAEGVQKVQFKAPFCAGQRLLLVAGRVVSVAHERLLERDERKAGVGAGEAGLAGDRVFETFLGDKAVARVEPEQVLQAQMILGPGIEPLGRTQARRLGLVQGDVQLKRRDDLGDDAGPDLVNAFFRA